MAKADYHGIAQAIAEILQADERLYGVPVLVESRVPMTDLQAGFIGVMLRNRRAADGQPIAAGTRMRLEVMYEIWCYGYALNDQTIGAYQTRDELIALVEVILMANRQLRGTANVLWLNGGDFESAQTEGGFLVGGSVNLTVEVLATL